MDLLSVLSGLSKKRPIFHSEADFQQTLAWELKEHYPQAKIRLEYKPLENERMYLDILAEIDGKKTAIELKYKTRRIETEIDGEKFALLDQGAQDIGRYDVLKDIQRLERIVDGKNITDGYLIFLTNDRNYFSDHGEMETCDKAFRLPEGRILYGELKWGENTSEGTMKGREEPIVLKGHYKVSWEHYSRVERQNWGEFRYLLVKVEPSQFIMGSSIRTDESVQVKVKAETFQAKAGSSEGKEGTSKIKDGLTKIKAGLSKIMAGSSQSSLDINEILSNLSIKRPVFHSQRDLRDSLAEELKSLGYSVSVDRILNANRKVDLWVEEPAGKKAYAIEVQYKTSRLMIQLNGEEFDLKHHSAQNEFRYDFIKDVVKLERVVRIYPNVTGYAIFITNDHLYWNPPRKIDSVDKDFRLHNKRVLAGTLKWSERAGFGTTSGREESLVLSGEYLLEWQHYSFVDVKKNGEFKALVVPVMPR